MYRWTYFPTVRNSLYQDAQNSKQNYYEPRFQIINIKLPAKWSSFINFDDYNNFKDTHIYNHHNNFKTFTKYASQPVWIEKYQA